MGHLAINSAWSEPQKQTIYSLKVEACVLLVGVLPSLQSHCPALWAPKNFERYYLNVELQEGRTPAGKPAKSSDRSTQEHIEQEQEALSSTARSSWKARWSILTWVWTAQEGTSGAIWPYTFEIIWLTYGIWVTIHISEVVSCGVEIRRLSSGSGSVCQTSAFKQLEKQWEGSISVNRLIFLELSRQWHLLFKDF